MGSVKGRISKELRETETIKKRWREYAEKLYKTGLCDLDNHDADGTHLEPNILQCEVKWALGSIAMSKASGGDGVPPDLSQILRDDAVKVLLSIWQQTWDTQSWKRSVFIAISKNGNAKECSNYHTVVLISDASKVLLKILQARP